MREIALRRRPLQRRVAWLDHLTPEQLSSHAATSGDEGDEAYGLPTPKARGRFVAYCQTGRAICV